jgi:Peptidase family S64
MATIEQAKQAAVAEFLIAAQPAAAIHALAVSTKPQQIVTGIGRGPKISNGVETGEECLRFYVERKVPKASLPAANLLPAVYQGVVTDVIETGRFRAGSPGGTHAAALAVLPGPVRTKLRPTHPGCSVGFQFTGEQAHFVMAGTYGAVVTDGAHRFILSNNHVLANENDLPVGSPIFQPGLLDGGDAATDQVAVLNRFIPLALAVFNLVDCAIARILDAAQASSVFLTDVGNLQSATPVVPVIGMNVEKVGRTTGYTQGQIFDASASVKVVYTMGTLVFNDQVLVQGTGSPFSDSGDSGSLIVDAAAKQGTALLFAGSEVMTIGNKLANVLTALGVSLVI